MSSKKIGNVRLLPEITEKVKSTPYANADAKAA
jgi:hypothetical protein